MMKAILNSLTPNGTPLKYINPLQLGVITAAPDGFESQVGQIVVGLPLGVRNDGDNFAMTFLGFCWDYPATSDGWYFRGLQLDESVTLTAESKEEGSL